MIVYDDMESSEKIKIYDKGVVVTRDRRSIYNALIDYRVGDMRAPHLNQTEALKLECADFAQCILKGVQPINDGHAGLRVVRVLEAAQRSLENRGKEIKL